MVPWDKIWEGIFSMQGGVPPALFVLVCGIAYLLGRELRKSERSRFIEHKDCSTAASQGFEKRIEEQRATLQILDRNAVNMAARTAAIDGTVHAMDEQSKGFQKLALTFEANNTILKDRQVYIEKQLEETLKLLRDQK